MSNDIKIGDVLFECNTKHKILILSIKNSMAKTMYMISNKKYIVVLYDVFVLKKRISLNLYYYVTS
jgi:hypothetical protein